MLSDVIFDMPHCEMYISSAAATTISDTTTYFPSAGTFTNSVTHKDFTVTSAGRMTYTGPRRRMAHVFITIAMTSGGSNLTLHFKILKNGAEVDSSEAQRKIGTGTDIGSTALHSMITMDTDDYLELGIRNETSATDVTMDNLNFGVMLMPGFMDIDIP
jgi:ribulose 1,5-bisphosphate synthetase/thiazole synthase